MDSTLKDIKVIYKSGHRYEITINPNDKHQFFGSPRRLEIFMTKLHALLVDALDNYKQEYKLFVELSEPHINVNSKSPLPRLHFHGTIKFVNELAVGQFLLKSLYKLSRFSNVTLNDYREDYWPKYISKQSLVMKALAKYYKVKVTIKNKQPLIIR